MGMNLAKLSEGEKSMQWDRLTKSWSVQLYKLRTVWHFRISYSLKILMLIRIILGRWEPAIEFLFPDLCKITIRVNVNSGEGFWHSLETEGSSNRRMHAEQEAGKRGGAYKRALAKLRFFSASDECKRPRLNSPRDGCDAEARMGWDEVEWGRDGTAIGRWGTWFRHWAWHGERGQVARQRTPGSEAKHWFVHIHSSSPSNGTPFGRF